MRLRQGSELKSLQSRLVKLQEKEKGALAELNDARNSYEKIKNQTAQIQDKIKNISNKPKKIVVTEHATLRFIERVKGINIETINKEILDKIGNIENTGSVTIKADNYRIVIKNNSVVSILEAT